MHELEMLAQRLADSPNSINLAPGLTTHEIAAIESRFGFAFPSEIRTFLEFALPLGDVPAQPRVIKNGRGFPNWRELDSKALRGQIEWPIEGALFDVEHNGFWLSSWGERPASTAAAIESARARLRGFPKLIPIYGHRYICEASVGDDNPVLSVWQTDIIYYGANLQDYLRREFFEDHGRECDEFGSPIPGWSEIIDA